MKFSDRISNQSMRGHFSTMWRKCAVLRPTPSPRSGRFQRLRLFTVRKAPSPGGEGASGQQHQVLCSTGVLQPPSPVLQPPWPLHSLWPLHSCLAVAQPPLPLHEFLAAQPPSPVLQPPLPLQEFMPLQACFSPAASSPANAADWSCVPARTPPATPSSTLLKSRRFRDMSFPLGKWVVFRAESQRTHDRPVHSPNNYENCRPTDATDLRMRHFAPQEARYGGWRDGTPRGLERYIVVETVALRARGHGLGGLARLARFPWLAPFPGSAAGAPAAAAQHLHVVRDDFGGVAVVALLVLPLAGAQASLDIDLRALAQILARHFAHAAEEGDVVPLGAFLPLPALVLEGVGGRHADIGHRHAARHGASLRVGAQMTDENDLVDASAGHGTLPRARRFCGPLF